MVPVQVDLELFVWLNSQEEFFFGVPSYLYFATDCKWLGNYTLQAINFIGYTYSFETMVRSNMSDLPQRGSLRNYGSCKH